MNTTTSTYYESVGDALLEAGRLNEAERAYRRAQSAMDLNDGTEDFCRVQHKIMQALGAG
jgi:predicted negative regulator of RcsB-dependent stress response